MLGLRSLLLQQVSLFHQLFLLSLFLSQCLPNIKAPEFSSYRPEKKRFCSSPSFSFQLGLKSSSELRRPSIHIFSSWFFRHVRSADRTSVFPPLFTRPCIGWLTCRRCRKKTWEAFKNHLNGWKKCGLPLFFLFEHKETDIHRCCGEIKPLLNRTAIGRPRIIKLKMHGSFFRVFFSSLSLPDWLSVQSVYVLVRLRTVQCTTPRLGQPAATGKESAEYWTSRPMPRSQRRLSQLGGAVFLLLLLQKSCRPCLSSSYGRARFLFPLILEALRRLSTMCERNSPPKNFYLSLSKCV